MESNLKRLHTQSCGCKKSPDLTGKTFGKLEVLGRSDERGSRGARTTPMWKCRCECGNITYKATDTLRNQSISMCAECAAKYSITQARKGAGFVDGTQICKIQSVNTSSTNTSGYRGVYYVGKTDRWRAQIIFKHKRYYLGTFKEKKDAIKARQNAEAELYESFLREYQKNIEIKACSPSP